MTLTNNYPCCCSPLPDCKTYPDGSVNCPIIGSGITTPPVTTTPAAPATPATPEKVPPKPVTVPAIKPTPPVEPEPAPRDPLTPDPLPVVKPPAPKPKPKPKPQEPVTGADTDVRGPLSNIHVGGNGDGTTTVNTPVSGVTVDPVPGTDNANTNVDAPFANVGVGQDGTTVVGAPGTGVGAGENVTTVDAPFVHVDNNDADGTMHVSAPFVDVGQQQDGSVTVNLPGLSINCVPDASGQMRCRSGGRAPPAPVARPVSNVQPTPKTPMVSGPVIASEICSG
jgi:hypothetical protein